MELEVAMVTSVETEIDGRQKCVTTPPNPTMPTLPFLCQQISVQATRTYRYAKVNGVDIARSQKMSK